MQRIDARKEIYAMIIPITIENVLQMTAGFISSAMIGRIGSLSVSAFGVSTRITSLVWALFKGVATGASVFVAQAYGAGDYKKVKKVIGQTLVSSIFFVIILQQVIFWYGRSLLLIFNPTPELAEAGFGYMRIVSWGLPFQVIMVVVAGVLQGMGNAKTPMKIALIMNLTNILAGMVLIFGKLGVPPMGLTGAAYATVISQITGALIGIYVLFNKDGVLGLSEKSSLLKLDIREVAKIYDVGLPTSMEHLFWQFAAIILTRIILSFGNTALAAYQLALQAESISYMPSIGFGVAATTFVGQSLGRGDNENGKVYMKELLKGTTVLTIFTAGILLIFPNFIMGLMTYEKDVIKIGAGYLFCMGLVQLPQNISGVFNGALRGAGYTRVPMIVAMVGLWGVRIPFSYIFTHYLHSGITAIWIVMCFDLVIRFILSFTLYKVKDIYNAKLLIDTAAPGKDK